MSSLENHETSEKTFISSGMRSRRCRKSTTTGHLIFKLGGVSQREMEKLQQEARK